MYPALTLWWRHIELTWLWIIISILVFCWIGTIYAKKSNLSAIQLFYALPTMMIITYFFGAYSGFVLTTWHIVPYSILELGQLIIPPNFWFNAAWLMVGFIISIFVFLFQLPPKSPRKKWFDVLALASMVAIMILGLFLTLGDHMIGLPTTSSIGIYALTPLSELNKFTAVLPVGIFLSVIALLSYIVTQFILKYQVREGWWFGTFSLFLFLLAVVLIFQIYPRHGVISIDSVQLDLNQYILLFLSILFAVAYHFTYQKHHFK